jgi:nucleotide-binding universal stress UspA family protein
MPADRLIFAGVSGSPGSVHALRYAADLARHHDAILVPLLTWVPPGGDLDECKRPSPDLRELWKDDAWQRLWAALDTAFGGFPSGVRTWPLVLRGKPGQVLVSAARQAGDLLVIGTGRRGPLRRLAGSRVSRYCLHHAQCPVLAIPPPALAQQASHGLRGWAFRHRGLDPDNADLPVGTS